MADHDDTPYIVIERRSGGFGSLVLGAMLGAAAGLLLAPRSGRDTRDELRAGALRIRDRAEDAVRGVTESVQDTIGGVRGEVEDRVDAARDAFEAGRRAARETRREMETRVQEVRAGVRGGINAARHSPETEPGRPRAADSSSVVPPAAGSESEFDA
ncbi:MAG: YtxH domain-containing protein [Gemmatimonadetes bacterium]|nr:YtxH domain-containing protein [Gemmatimonadota bacterium]